MHSSDGHEALNRAASKAKPKKVKVGMKDEDYDQEAFDAALCEILDEQPASNLLTLPGVYEVLADLYNNEVIEHMRRKAEAENVEVSFVASDPTGLNQLIMRFFDRRQNNSWTNFKTVVQYVGENLLKINLPPKGQLHIPKTVSDATIRRHIRALASNHYLTTLIDKASSVKGRARGWRHAKWDSK